MDAIGEKLAKQFKLTAEEVDALRADGLDTPRKLRAAGIQPHSRRAPVKAAARECDDFTAISGIGREIDQALHSAGFDTFADLDAAPDVALLAIPGLGQSLLGKIRAFLQERR